jgi:hypothetical protein
MSLKLTAFALTFLLACSAQAEFPQKIKDFTHEFTVGLESLHYHYDETFKEHNKYMEFNGLNFGVNGSYQLTYKDIFFVRPEARIVYGHVDYKSPTIGQDTMKNAPNFIFETRLLSGLNFKPITSLLKFTLSPYIGIGYRYKSDDMSDMKSKNNLSGHKRVNKLWYVPLGIRFNHDFESRWFMQGLAEYDWMIQGRHLTYDKHCAPSPLVNKQKSGWGARGEILTGYHFDKTSVSFGPYINYWKIKKSSKFIHTYYSDSGAVYRNAPAWEPANMTHEMGVKLNFTF